MELCVTKVDPEIKVATLGYEFSYEESGDILEGTLQIEFEEAEELTKEQEERLVKKMKTLAKDFGLKAYGT